MTNQWCSWLSDTPANRMFEGINNLPLGLWWNPFKRGRRITQKFLQNSAERMRTLRPGLQICGKNNTVAQSRKKEIAFVGNGQIDWRPQPRREIHPSSHSSSARAASQSSSGSCPSQVCPIIYHTCIVLFSWQKSIRRRSCWKTKTRANIQSSTGPKFKTRQNNWKSSHRNETIARRGCFLMHLHVIFCHIQHFMSLGGSYIN